MEVEAAGSSYQAPPCSPPIRTRPAGRPWRGELPGRSGEEAAAAIAGIGEMGGKEAVAVAWVGRGWALAHGGHSCSLLTRGDAGCRLQAPITSI